MDTYTERVGRWRIMRHDELPPEHQAEYRIQGIDPANLWSLIWSFDCEDAARKMLAECRGRAASWQTFKLVDGGAATVVERLAW